MIKTPRLALFQPLDSMAGTITPLFRKPYDYEIQEVNSTAQLADLARDNSATFDAIIVPSILFDKSSAVTLCIQIKSEEILLGIPVIVLSNIKDKPAISTFYGAGADMVVIAPFDADLLHLQLLSICRMALSFQEELENSTRDNGLRQAMISALHFIDNALVILDTKPSVVFANQAAKNLFKLYNSEAQEEENKIYTKLEDIVKETLPSLIVTQTQTSSTPAKPLRLRNTTLPRTFGADFQADLRLLPLTSGSSQQVAYCLSIDDISTPRELSNTLLQAERTQTLTLQFAAVCMKFLESDSLGIPGKSLSKIENYLAAEVENCLLSSVMTSLLELIDIIVSTSSVIKVSIIDELNIAMKASDLFQLLGNLILFTMRCSASQAETSISLTTEESLSHSAKLTIRSVLPANATSRTDEKMLTAIRSQIIELTQSNLSDQRDKPILSISRAQEIADKYKVQIRKNILSELEVEIQIDLPVVGA